MRDFCPSNGPHGQHLECARTYGMQVHVSQPYHQHLAFALSHSQGWRRSRRDARLQSDDVVRCEAWLLSQAVNIKVWLSGWRVAIDGSGEHWSGLTKSKAAAVARVENPNSNARWSASVERSSFNLENAYSQMRRGVCEETDAYQKSVWKHCERYSESHYAIALIRETLYLSKHFYIYLQSPDFCFLASLFAVYLYINYITNNEKENTVAVPCEYSATLRNAFARAHQYHYDRSFESHAVGMKAVLVRRLEKLGLDAWECYTILFNTNLSTRWASKPFKASRSPWMCSVSTMKGEIVLTTLTIDRETALKK